MGQARYEMRPAKTLLLASLLIGCTACAPLGPDYARPQVALPSGWKPNSGMNPSQWRPTQPADDLPKHDWWTIFGDDQLNELEERCLEGNPTLQAAVARLDQAMAQSKAQGAALFPTVQLDAAASRVRTSANRPLAAYSSPNYSTVQNDFRPILSVSYEVDWLGSIRRGIESAQAVAQQVSADTENVRLVLTAQVAQTYFQLRQLDEEIRTVTELVAVQNQVLDLIIKRHDSGASSLADVVQQTALTDSSRAQQQLLITQRNQQENALATLTGTPAASFRIQPGYLPSTTPVIPAGVPSALLERRPDISATERGMAAANAQIGIARAGFFPSLTLTPAYAGYESSALSNLVSTPSLVWALGVSASETIVDGGRISAGVDFAKAGYTWAVANYRQSVLTAIEETQDALSNLHDLEVAKQNQDAAVVNQDKAYQLSLIRYEEGLDNALTLATIEQNQLSARRVQSQIHGSQFVTIVALVKALGGGWKGLNAPG
jgi:multidrug efflux system outer membrane protein